MKQIEVVAAVIIHNDDILCVQRGANKHPYISKKYEFPGGKVEENEIYEDALTREIHEELEMRVSVEYPYLTVEHVYPDFEIVMHSFICSCPDKRLSLHEHIDFKWLSKEQLDHLDWAAADIPIVEKLMRS